MTNLKKELESEWENKNSKLNQKEKELKKSKKNIEITLQKKLLKLAEVQRDQITNEIKSLVEDENKIKFEKLQYELNQKNNKVKNLLGLEAEIEKIKREREEDDARNRAEFERQLNLRIEESVNNYKKTFESESELQIKELLMKLDDQKKLIDEQQKKINQGSMQLQGEAQEQAIEDWLIQIFPNDQIIEIKKGANGADCIQVINNNGIECGKIYYESKRTKSFQDSWISKFKKDMQEKGVDMGILVTKTMPKNMTRMGLYKGIYICTYEEFKGLSAVLRNVVIDFNQFKIFNENKGDKKIMLYDYVTSKEFFILIQNLAEAFNNMNKNLEKEKRQAIINFEKRRALLEIIKTNIFEMSGRFTGIAGKNYSVNNISNGQKLVDLLTNK